MKTFSIVIPVYYNESNLPETIPQLLSLADALHNYHLELVFVEDGSGDNSLKILIDYQKQYSATIKVVKLTRNFGSMLAIQAGCSVASGDCIGMIAADLQDPPELFLDMIEHWERGNKAIFAVRQDREESFSQKLFANIYYSLIRKLAIQDYPPGGFDFFLVDRQVISEINQIQEKNTNLMTLIFWLGFKPVLLPYVRRQRKKGKSRWTLTKKIKLFMDTFVSFTFFPVRALSVLGITMALLSFLYGLSVFSFWFFGNIEVKGYVPTMLVITFASGLQMSMLGVLGEYLWRILDEVRHRPSFVIDQIYSITVQDLP